MTPDKISRALCAAMLLAISVMPAVAAGQLEEPSDSQSLADDDARFDGYLFCDANGSPLPFQTDAEIEELLAESLIVSVQKIPVGVTSPQKLELAHGTLRFNAAFKKIDRKQQNVTIKTGGKPRHYLEWHDWYGYDIAAYRLDRLLGLNRVPPVVERKIKRDKGSVSAWLEGSITEKERQKRGMDPPDIARFNQQKQTLRLFDNLVANQDSNLGNTLIDGNWTIWFIDCSRCFGTSSELIYPQAVTHCDREVLQALRDLDIDEATAALSGFLSRSEIKALFERRDKILAHIDALIEKSSEEMVLFDSRPPTDRAPWVED